ncbi:MAG: hypothetical protein ABIK89_00225, partial [Planctomycetota bacterium]
MTSRRRFLCVSAAAALGVPLVTRLGRPSLALAADEPNQASSSPDPAADDEEFALDFETAETRGSIRAEGPYHGVARLVHKQTGLQVIDSRYSALNLFRLFSTNLGMGTPRAMERQTKTADQSVEIHWPATEEHQGEITALYEVREPNVVDLTVTVRSLGTYSNYEILLPNYFDKTLVPHVYLKPSRRGSKGESAVDLVVPTVSDVFRGGVLQFPRDAHAARMCLDGRWSRSEYAMSVAPFYPVRHYGRCLALVTDPGKKVGAVVMADPRRCAAISARYYAENDEDRLTSYTAIDFSLFGEDFL